LGIAALSSFVAADRDFGDRSAGKAARQPSASCSESIELFRAS